MATLQIQGIFGMQCSFLNSPYLKESIFTFFTVGNLEMAIFTFFVVVGNFGLQRLVLPSNVEIALKLPFLNNKKVENYPGRAITRLPLPL